MHSLGVQLLTAAYLLLVMCQWKETSIGMLLLRYYLGGGSYSALH